MIANGTALVLQPHEGQATFLRAVNYRAASYVLVPPLAGIGGALTGFGVAAWIGTIAGAFAYPKDQDIGLGLAVVAIGALAVIAGAVAGIVAAFRILSRHE